MHYLKVRAVKKLSISLVTFLSFLTLSVTFPVNSANAATYTVDKSGGGDYTAIQFAIDDPLVVDGDTIIVNPGTYSENIDFKGKAITLKSANGPSVTSIKGYKSSPIVTFNSGEGRGSVLSGFTIGTIIASPSDITDIITGSNDNGGGIYCESFSSPTIIGSTISENDAKYNGGGIYCKNDSPSGITDSTIAGNSANYSADIYSTSDSQPTIKYSR